MIEQNHEYHVSLEVARLLKQAGFDWLCNHAICCDSTHYPNLKEGDVLEYNYLECSELMEGKKSHMLLCPTLEVAQRWLREVKHTHIDTFPVLDNLNNWAGCIYSNDVDNCLTWDGFNTYEEALEAGIKKVLEIILEKGE